MNSEIDEADLANDESLLDEMYYLSPQELEAELEATHRKSYFTGLLLGLLIGLVACILTWKLTHNACSNHSEASEFGQKDPAMLLCEF